MRRNCIRITKWTSPENSAARPASGAGSLLSQSLCWPGWKALFVQLERGKLLCFGFFSFLLSSEVDAAMLLIAGGFVDGNAMRWMADADTMYMKDEERCILLSAGLGRITR